MEFGVVLMALPTPSEPFAPWPPGAFQTLSWSYVHLLPPAAVKYFVKLSVVPEPSERWNVTIVELGRVAFGFTWAIAGSFHFETVPEKISESSSGVIVRSLR